MPQSHTFYPCHQHLSQSEKYDAQQSPDRDSLRTVVAQYLSATGGASPWCVMMDGMALRRHGQPLQQKMCNVRMPSLAKVQLPAGDHRQVLHSSQIAWHGQCHRQAL